METCEAYDLREFCGTPDAISSRRKVKKIVEYKNIGVYVMCRIPTIGRAEYFRKEAYFKATRNFSPDQKNITMYMDEVRIGEECERSNLDRLIADAMEGKIDHIVIADVLDLWHSPQKIFDMVQMLKQQEKPVSIQSFPTSQYWTLRNPVPFDDREKSLLLNSLHALRMVNDLQFVYDNYDTLDRTVRNSLIYRSIDPEMMEEYLLFYYLEPRDMEIADFAKQIGVETTDIDVIKECWSPNVKQHDMMIDILGKEMIAFHLV